MKKNLFLLLIFCGLVSCTEPYIAPDPIRHYNEGEEVTLYAAVGGETSEGVDAPARVNATKSGEQIVFKWETGDQILVTVNGKSSVFTLTSGAGSTLAKFKGTMPASGETYDVQFPVTEPDLSNQTYVKGGLPYNMMLCKATGCTTESFELKPQYSALCLNLKYDGYMTYYLERLVVTNITSSAKPSYNLKVAEPNKGVKLSSTASAYYLVVPSGAYKFRLDVIGTANTVSTSFSTSKAQKFVAGQCLNMPSKSIGFTAEAVDLGLPSGLKWVNEDAEAYAPQMASGWYPWGDVTTAGNTHEALWSKYIWGTQYALTKYCTNASYGVVDNKTTIEEADDAVRAKLGSPYRMPTLSSFQELITYCTFTWTTWNGAVGCLVKGPNGNAVYLPAAGYAENNSRYNNGVACEYWSSTLDSASPDKAYYLKITSSGPTVVSGARYQGRPVRGVCM